MKPKRSYSRREFLGVGIASVGAATFLSSRWIEPFWPEFNQKIVRIKKRLAQPISILHISDLHAFDSMPLSYFDSCIKRAIGWKPDLICVTGDFISTKLDDETAYGEILLQLSSVAPTYACLGNHDGGAWAVSYGGYSDTTSVESLLQQSQILCLKDRGEVISIRGSELVLFGANDLWTVPIDTIGLKSSPAELPVIVMAHNPDSKDQLADVHWDLMLSGHSHGGQLVYPVIGGGPFCVVRDKRYSVGMNRWRDRWIHTSRGLGTVHGIRFNCPPEATLIHLVGTRV